MKSVLSLFIALLFVFKISAQKSAVQEEKLFSYTNFASSVRGNGDEKTVESISVQNSLDNLKKSGEDVSAPKKVEYIFDFNSAKDISDFEELVSILIEYENHIKSSNTSTE